jgi:hypothetical protein
VSVGSGDLFGFLDSVFVIGNKHPKDNTILNDRPATIESLEIPDISTARQILPQSGELIFGRINWMPNIKRALRAGSSSGPAFDLLDSVALRRNLFPACGRGNHDLCDRRRRGMTTPTGENDENNRKQALHCRTLKVRHARRAVAGFLRTKTLRRAEANVRDRGGQ